MPSIVFGLLGLAVFLNVFGVPRSTPLVGGLVLTLMTLPTIIIASRAALKSVPPSIREAALGVGASPLQAQFHHVLPLAMPGMLTGTIIGMARRLGRDGATAHDRHDRLHRRHSARIHRSVHGAAGADLSVGGQPGARLRRTTSAAIMVLLAFLMLMNLTRSCCAVVSNVAGRTGAMNMPNGEPHDPNHGQARTPTRKHMNSTADALTGNTGAMSAADLSSHTELGGTVGTVTVENARMRCSKVDVFYGDKQAIKNVSLDIGNNEVISMIGPSGCGKSTFLRCLNRMNDTIRRPG